MNDDRVSYFEVAASAHAGCSVLKFETADHAKAFLLALPGQVGCHFTLIGDSIAAKWEN